MAICQLAPTRSQTAWYLPMEEMLLYSGFPQVDVPSHLLVDFFYDIREVDISEKNGTHFWGIKPLAILYEIFEGVLENDVHEV